ncbi:MAG TPA: sigma 54 modulation/S30EA ribosomal C-terminal domain-containing protein [Candidatus Limnocylindrales bacterium]|nr:sigma 54 modulation/S30EA ribosomal C-terminal domain-containing protein [Candidatus Limnocylindrales bacterium]
MPATILEAGRRAEEDAIARMEELGHTFYVFVDRRRSGFRSSIAARTAITA